MVLNIVNCPTICTIFCCCQDRKMSISKDVCFLTYETHDRLIDCDENVIQDQRQSDYHYDVASGTDITPLKSINHYSCIGIRYAKLFEAAKIHVQIMRFTCYLNMVLNLTKPKLGPDLCTWRLHGERVAALTDRENVAIVYDVVAV